MTESIGGISSLLTFEYDSKGRLYRKYFNGATEYEQYDYDTNSGYLYRIQFTAGGTTATVWQLTTMDEYGHIRQATIGSASVSWGYDSNNMLSQIAATGVQQYNYSFDVNTGNLNSRTNFLKNKTESFGYDSNKLDRLASVTGPENLDISYTTNNNGNIYSKSDAGDYTLYDGYAVKEISGAQNIPETYQEIDYYSFEKVKKITEDDKTAEFEYNADRQRIRMTLKTSGTATKTRWYFGSSCEREDVGGTITNYIWIGGDAYTAVAVAKKTGTGSWTVYNIFRDHLGTITHLKNGSNPADEYSFDAWGRRRDKDDWTYTLTGEPALFADRGFTTHEYLADFNLYNMNGRLYDPLLGRFLSPDENVQMPDFSQNFNRYSYALNNPLMYSDPDGEFIFSALLPGIGTFIDAACWGAVIGGAGYTASVAFSDGGFKNWNGGAFWKSIGIGAITGVATAGVGQMYGPVGSNGFTGELARAYTHGFASGMISEFSGGDFMSGFAAGGLSSIAGSSFMMYGGRFANSTLGAYSFSGLAGGVGSELSGGNFWQGAAIGVMNAGLNHLQQGIDNGIIGKRLANRISDAIEMDRENYLYNLQHADDPWFEPRRGINVDMAVSNKNEYFQNIQIAVGDKMLSAEAMYFYTKNNTAKSIGWSRTQPRALVVP